jgi:uncharacterized protein YbjT (DUF2867 family)
MLVILVLGGTGLVGAAVLRRLTELGAPTRALVRRLASTPESPARSITGDDVDMVVGDAADPASLHRAMRGVQQVFLVMANGPQQQQHELAVVHAAAVAGVEHLVKVSAPYVAPDSPVAIARTHHAGEQEHPPDRARAGMQHTFLRPYAFMHNLRNNAPTSARAGYFTGTTGDAPMEHGRRP